MGSQLIHVKEKKKKIHPHIAYILTLGIGFGFTVVYVCVCAHVRKCENNLNKIYISTSCFLTERLFVICVIQSDLRNLALHSFAVT